ncbi:MAG: hypothetical protein AB1815_05885 [Bacillota bacterium]
MELSISGVFNDPLVAIQEFAYLVFFGVVTFLLVLGLFRSLARISLEVFGGQAGRFLADLVDVVGLAAIGAVLYFAPAAAFDFVVATGEAVRKILA